MSLTIYTEKSAIPSGMPFIDWNDQYFQGVSLKDTPVTRKILYQIDKAEYHSPLTFIGRDPSLGALNKEDLSTGCKTLLNILYSPTKCFSVIGCGQNALELLSLIDSGNILWETPSLYLSVDVPCNVCVHGRHFTSMDSLMYYLMDVYRRGRQDD